MLKLREALFFFHEYKSTSPILVKIPSELLAQDLSEINSEVNEKEFFYFNS